MMEYWKPRSRRLKPIPKSFRLRRLRSLTIKDVNNKKPLLKVRTSSTAYNPTTQ
jgi:hypothetical protein